MASEEELALTASDSYQTGRGERENAGVDQTETEKRDKKNSVKVLVWIVKILLFLSVLSCLVLSKLTIIEMLAELHLMVNYTTQLSNSSEFTNAPDDIQRTVNLYWQVLFVIMVPNVLTWLRSIFSGLLTKSQSHPWPKRSAIILGIINAAIEAIAECSLVFLVFTALPPEIVIFLLSGVVPIQALYNIYTYISARKSHNDQGYRQIGHQTPHIFQLNGRKVYILTLLLTVTGLVFQFCGLISLTGLIVKAYYMMKERLLLGCFIVPCFLFLSFSWTSGVQRATFEPSEKSLARAQRSKMRMKWIRDSRRPIISDRITARWKASFIATSVRLVLYPIASYIIVRSLYHLQSESTIDPWCIKWDTDLDISDAFSWTTHDSTVFGVHIVSSFLAYVLQGLACYMTLHSFGLAFPVFLATPISIGVYFMSNSVFKIRDTIVLFPFTTSDIQHLSWSNTLVSEWHEIAFGLAIIIWIGQILITGYNLLKCKNVILASDENMFVRPYYNSVFLEQYLAINRSVTHSHHVINTSMREPSKVFICSTMFRENSTEMRQMLRSIYRVAKYCQKERKCHRPCDTFESHIFFDGGCRGDELSSFAIQVMSLVPEIMNVKLTQATKQQTPYGYRFKWNLLQNCMPFVIHLKDNQKVKNKKRWSQVMYMKYVLEYRAMHEEMDLNNTFILTTDADIDFKAESALVLLDMLARDPLVGAVCSRTHPLGYGILYWYQIFDYAVGHWLQKGTEHILGSVLCCPGCFSLFRCSALQDCLSSYSSEVNNAMEFLMKDMGEDRWLCTLLIEEGWRLEYCAISNDYTYCPVEFDEFYKQRRRWIPSTIANLWLLVSKSSKMTANNESIGWLFIIYEVFVIISTILAPATVILIISSGLSTAFSLSIIGVIVSLLLVSVIYGVVCLYTSQKTQLDVAKILTFIFSVVMAVVIVGILKEVIKDVLTQIENPSDIESESSNSTTSFTFPVSEITIYFTLFGIIFFFTAFFHCAEFFTLFHCLWYLLGLPSGYLFLLIYSTANLNSRSWGTREKSDNSASVFGVLWIKIKALLLKCLSRIDGSVKEKKKETSTEGKEEKLEAEEKPLLETNQWMGLEEPTSQTNALEATTSSGRVYPWILNWLRELNCEHFYDNFVNEGYTEDWYVAGMTAKDLQSIAIKPEGFVRHLEKAIKKLPLIPLQVGIPKNVEEWIVDLKMETEEDGYVQRFRSAGYFGENDVENLRLITEEELTKGIGVRKRAHIKRFLQGISNLKARSPDEERIAEAQMALQVTNDHQPGILEDQETAFWLYMSDTLLRPIPEGLTQVSELKDELRFLRNYTLIAVLLINLIWIILLYMLTIDELQSLGLSTKFLSLMFLLIYGVILVVQFIAMMLHRLVTLAHYIARLNQSLPVEQTLTLDLTHTVAITTM